MKMSIVYVEIANKVKHTRCESNNKQFALLLQPIKQNMSRESSVLIMD